MGATTTTKNAENKKSTSTTGGDEGANLAKNRKYTHQDKKGLEEKTKKNKARKTTKSATS